MLALVQAVANNQADLTLCDRYYDEVLLDWGHMPILVNVSLIPVGPGQDSAPDETYLLPAQAVVPLQFYYDDHIVNDANERELINWRADWRTLRGTPLVVYRSDVGDRRFKLVPQPDRPSKPLDFFLGAPLGLNYPGYSVAVVHTETRQDVPSYLELPLAFAILGREFSRESDHQDIAFAGACITLSDALKRMVL